MSEDSTPQHEVRHCQVCGGDWILHVPTTLDDELAKLFGKFDFVGAMNKLLAAHHAYHARDEISRACWEAYMVLFRARETYGPEQQVQVAILRAARETRSAAEKLRSAIHAARQGWTWRTIPWAAAEGTLMVVANLLRWIALLESKWDPDGSARKLSQPGRAPKLLLKEAEEVLRQGGLSEVEIAQLDLDGQGATNREVSSDRVQKRARGQTGQRGVADLF